MAARQHLEVGSWYAVPLRRHEGYGVGLITQANVTFSHLVGYFFGPRRDTFPAPDDLLRYRPGDAILVALFGFGTAHWTYLGAHSGWDPSVWPMPVFGRIVDPPGIGIRVEYLDSNPAAIPRESSISLEEARRLPTNSYFGHGAIEVVLTNRLMPHAPQGSVLVGTTGYGDVNATRTDSVGHATITQIAHFLSEQEAINGQRMLEQTGYRAERAANADPLSGEIYWSVYAYQEALHDDQATLDRSCREVEQIVHASGGVYDGYERTPFPRSV